MPPHNRAAWLLSKELPRLVVKESPYTPPGANEVVIRTRAIGLNPVEPVILQTGMLIPGYPTILGSDIAGVVEEVGDSLKSAYKVGDRVLASTTFLAGPPYGGFQQYVVQPVPMVAKIPDRISFAEAAVLPVGITTAASCLFEAATLGLEMPPGNGGSGKTLLIWGASSAIGMAGVQLAAAAGYEVFAVASRHNFEVLKSLGATKCFDRGSGAVLDELVAGLKGKDVVGAYDCISTAETIVPLCEILHASGGRKAIATVIPVEDGVVKHGVAILPNFGIKIADSGVGLQIWKHVVEPGLASGSIKCKPDARIVGRSLEDIQQGLDLRSQGVSAEKLVVTLAD